MLLCVRSPPAGGYAIAIFVPTIGSAGEVRYRQINQQQRIYTGARQGTISPQEYRDIQRRQAALEAARRRDLRSGNGLNARERYRLNQRQNELSRTIYRYKRN
ncbi:hypothetical protein NIES4074_56290 [Cylindrospermum sp. NIES-4074]|nr:hypothetical protein NIES4074_56290 [Cylindrospermum sp. NIES-4074]